MVSIIAIDNHTLQGLLEYDHKPTRKAPLTWTDGWTPSTVASRAHVQWWPSVSYQAITSWHLAAGKFPRISSIRSKSTRHTNRSYRPIDHGWHRAEATD